MEKVQKMSARLVISNCGNDWYSGKKTQVGLFEKEKEKQTNNALQVPEGCSQYTRK